MNQRDLELLSAYLDGQLTPFDSTRLETRLTTEPQLASVLNDLSATRSLLRKLPQRRAPRNFTLTRKMVGQNPPLPRAYPIFRFATALATLLFVFSFGLNSVGRLAAPAYGVGGSGGGDASQEEIQSFAAEVPMAPTEAPAATEAPVAEPAVELAPASTLAPTEVSNAARSVETPASKAGDAADALGQQNQVEVQSEALRPALVPSAWQIVLAIVAILCALLMFMMRRIAISRWR